MALPPVAVDRFRWDQPRDDVYLPVSPCALQARHLVVEPSTAWRFLFWWARGLNAVAWNNGRSDSDHHGPAITAAGGAVAGSMSRLCLCRIGGFRDCPGGRWHRVHRDRSGRGGLRTVRCAASGMADATGVLFPDQTVDSLTEAVRWFERRQLWQVLDAAVLRQWAELPP